MHSEGLKLRKVLLVGGAGYIGSVLAAHLLGNGARVRVLDSLLYRNTFSPLALLHNERYEFHYGDMGNSEVMEHALEDVTDVIILAGLVGDPICKTYPEESERVNQSAVSAALTVISSKLLESAIFISTCSNYGLIPESVQASETYPLAPLSIYARAKVDSEQRFLDVMQKGNVKKPVVLRFATAFGLSPRMRFDLTVNEFVRELYFGENLEVFDPDTWRPYCHVSDFARLVEIVIEATPEQVAFEIFNAGGDQNNHTKREIVEIISKHNLPGNAKFVSGGKDSRNYKVDFEKVRSVLGFEPRYSVDYGVQQLVKALGQNLFPKKKGSERILGNYEIELTPRDG